MPSDLPDWVPTPGRGPVTPNAPGTFTASGADQQLLAANAGRTGLVICNNSGATLYLAFGQAAVLGSGIVLRPGSIYEMDDFMFSTAAVHVIASQSSAAVGYQEFQ